MKKIISLLMAATLLATFLMPSIAFASYIETTKVEGSDTATEDNFGESVAVYYSDSESLTWLVIGAPEFGTSAGAAYVFEQNHPSKGQWGLRVKLVGSDTADGDLFGSSVSMTEDYIVVGAPGDDDNGAQSGTAFVFNKNQGGDDNWGQQAKLTASDGAADDQFGGSVSIDGDYIAVGAKNNDRTYIFDRGGGWSDTDEDGILSDTDISSGDEFGKSVQVAGNYVIVGSPGEQVGANSDQGAAYIYKKSGSWEI